MSRRARPFILVGHGYDLHRLAAPPEGRPFVLGGIPIPHNIGPVAHSDGDALLHAVTDAVLGALGEPDIGQLFPDTDDAHANRDSAVFVREAARRANLAGYAVGNLDGTVICERPKIGPHREAIAGRVAELLGVSRDRINIKGKTHEGVDAVGESRAIEVHVVVALERIA